MILYDKVIERFQIPPEGEDIVEQILTPGECALLSGWEGGERFSGEALRDFLLDRGLAGSAEEADTFLADAFRRGVVNRDGEHYRFGSFYGRLDIFATAEPESYRGLSEEKRKELDRWYFERYLERLGSAENRLPTEDEILPLEEVLDFIDRKKEQPYLALCDCRMLTGDCGKPVRTCITYRTAENSFVSRGHAEPITKEQAKQVVTDADRAGLMHTVNPGGVCSCCTDCCYLFRAAEARGSQGSWPVSHYRVKLDRERCIGCGACVRRCHFQVFAFDADGSGQAELPGGSAAPEGNPLSGDGDKRGAGSEGGNPGRKTVREARGDRCVGCGICVTGCPAGALRLEPIEWT